MVPRAFTFPAPVTPTVSGALVAVAAVNVAVTLRACVIVTVHVETVPVHAPPQPVNVAPELGVAASVTRALAACGAVHVVPQLRPAPVMVPLPEIWAESTYVVLLPTNRA